MDTAPAEAYAQAHGAITAISDDIELRRLRVRESGGHYFADAAALPPVQAMVAGQGISDHIQAAVRRSLPDSEVVVRLEPRRDGLSLRGRARAAALAEPLVRDVHDIGIYDHSEDESVSLHLKMDPEVPLVDAHEVAERVEGELRAEPEVVDVHTHLEPLEGPWLAQENTPEADEMERQRIIRLIEGRTGQAPRELRLLRTADGLVHTEP